MKTIEKVLKLLNEDDRCRDNDELLIALVWYMETDRTMTAYEWLLKYSKRGFTSAESIRRCRQKLQEKNPGLRGKTWSYRHKINHDYIFQ